MTTEPQGAIRSESDAAIGQSKVSVIRVARGVSIRAADELEALGESIRFRVEQSRARVTIGFPLWLRFFLLRGVVAITLGSRVYVSPALLDRGRGRCEAILQHELVHVGQVRDHGLIRFLFRYVMDYVRLRRQGLSAQQAYLEIPYEIEARAAEGIGRS